jgi:DNA-binding GntR family transcriptional regulator
MARVRGRRMAATHTFLDPFPKYLQIREILLRRIEREMRIGDRLPTEHALCEQFGVSRETVRDALGGLEADGMISRTPGQGTFVARLPPPGRRASPASPRTSAASSSIPRRACLPKARCCRSRRLPT